jgi:hypothetical protein
MAMIGYKKSLGNSMMGYKKALGKHMMGHRSPLLDLAKIDIVTRDLEEKKKSGGLERAKRGSGWKMGQYA